ncbi:nuclease-related domain-containing protein [Cytobacillus dafuensis]|uniref:NERD domain-containing protein n=1 Tax=Cytobacillus dafuensis TaxID=1742359 RepID=A0A5B8Z0M2_CYTDA|nr:nuclease-related domain-containing protein [Cytobacillus dafuensis]QED46257.1 NERD domain-containing protein [Cytobacillus dafuensis]
MLIKQRTEPVELKLLRFLNARMELSEKEKNIYLNLEKGFKGELWFDNWLENLSGEWLVLNDLLLESNNSVFQIDTLLITSEKIYLFEIKNYEGDFYIQGDKWYTISKSEIKNPIFQLERSGMLFRGLLQELGFSSPIESYLIFVNPDFFLYQTPLSLPIVSLAQLNRFKNKLIMNEGILKKRHSKFAEQLVSICLKESPYTRLPEYNYDQLERGVTCAYCYSLMDSLTEGEETIVCKECGGKENVISAILRSTEEFKLLFPDRKITTNEIFEWCKGVKSSRSIRRILSKKYELIKQGRSSYFEPNFSDTK